MEGCSRTSALIRPVGFDAFVTVLTVPRRLRLCRRPVLCVDLPLPVRSRHAVGHGS